MFIHKHPDGISTPKPGERELAGVIEVTAEQASRPRSARSKKPARAKAREGKVAVMGYFSPDLSTKLHVIRAHERTSLQALLGEAIDLLLEKRGYDPAGER